MKIEIPTNKKMVRNYPQFFVIARKYGLEKSELALAFSKGKTESLRELSDTEFADCLAHLSHMQRQNAKSFDKADWQPKPGDATRKRMMAICHQMKWGDTEQILIRLDEWLMAQKFKKELMDHTPHELGLMAHILKVNVLGSYLKGLNP